MTVSPSGAITVVPSSLATSSAAVAGLAAEVRGQPLPPLGADVLGSPECGAALARAGGLVELALRASAEGLDEITAALTKAAQAYQLAELLALGPQRP
jgi:hypothetical protein